MTALIFYFEIFAMEFTLQGVCPHSVACYSFQVQQPAVLFLQRLQGHDTRLAFRDYHYLPQDTCYEQTAYVHKYNRVFSKVFTVITVVTVIS